MNPSAQHTEPPDSMDESNARQNGSRQTAIGFVVIVLLIAGAGLSWVWFPGSRRTAAPLPNVDVRAAHPEVAALIRSAREDVAGSPNSGIAWGSLGMVLEAHEYQAEAVECFEQASQLDSREFRWPYFLGVALEANDRERALSYYRDAVRLGPPIALFRLRLAETLVTGGQLVEAETAIRAALELEPGNPRAQFRMGQIALRRGRLSESLRWAKQAAKNEPQHRAAHELLAQIYTRLDDSHSADAEMTKTRQLSSSAWQWPDPFLLEIAELRRDPHWLAIRADELLRSDQTTAAVDVLKKLVADHPKDWTFRADLARAYISIRDYRHAAEILERGIELSPDTFEMQRLRGTVYLLEEQWGKAAKRLREAIELKPDNAAVHLDLGHCLERLGDADSALAAYRTALRFRPDFIEAHFGLGRLLLDAGEADEAAEHLRTVQELAPTHGGARRLLRATQAE